ncbi:MAG: hypothetical protein J7598_20765 [Mitsuaria chitosanitabida]|uniref:hypothetical protein n=1 Tax=Roseateles chitosanitabidus TaxID=65048 RepID=UPI001B0C0D6E|nr:hypothetical protein [Roseateles chitosanitabidus]MBO9689042.1 hypothetical protein [Roseateles chitosanitabidus]
MTPSIPTAAPGLALCALLVLTACGGGTGATDSPPAAATPTPVSPVVPDPVSTAASESAPETDIDGGGPATSPEPPPTPASDPASPAPSPSPPPAPAPAQPPAPSPASDTEATPPLTPAPSPSPPLELPSTGEPPAVVDRTVLGILVSTPTRRNQRSVAELQAALFSSRGPSLRTFYWLQSGGRLNVTTRDLVPADTPIAAGDVIEVTIPDPTGTECTGDAWGKAARVEAAKLGFDQGGYDTTIYISPKVSGCSNAVGTVGTVGKVNRSRRVVYFDKTDSPATSPLTLRTLVHEMGHNLGLGHARTLTCVDAAGQRAALSTSCTEDVQGDPTDGMGTTGRVSNPGPAPGDDHSPMDPNPRLFAASRVHDLGWMAAGEVQVVTGPGQYRLRPLYCSTPNGAPRALRLASTTTGRDYWLETRIACGGAFDNFIVGSIHHGVTDTTVNGLLIRQGDAGPGPSGSTFLLDLHPGTTNGSSGFVDAALSRGEVFTDPLPGGLRFEITDVEADGTLVVRIW